MTLVNECICSHFGCDPPFRALQCVMASFEGHDTCQCICSHFGYDILLGAGDGDGAGDLQSFYDNNPCCISSMSNLERSSELCRSREA